MVHFVVIGSARICFVSTGADWLDRTAHEASAGWQDPSASICGVKILSRVAIGRSRTGSYEAKTMTGLPQFASQTKPYSRLEGANLLSSPSLLGWIPLSKTGHESKADP